MLHIKHAVWTDKQCLMYTTHLSCAISSIVLPLAVEPVYDGSCALKVFSFYKSQKRIGRSLQSKATASRDGPVTSICIGVILINFICIALFTIQIVAKQICCWNRVDKKYKTPSTFYTSWLLVLYCIIIVVLFMWILCLFSLSLYTTGQKDFWEFLSSSIWTNVICCSAS